MLEKMTHPFNSDSVKAKMIGFPRHRRNQAGNAGCVILVLVALVIAVVVGMFNDGKTGGAPGSGGGGSDSGGVNRINKFVAEKIVQIVSKPRLPIGLMTRTAITGRSKVMELTSEADRPYIIGVSVKRPATGATKTFAYKSEPGKTEEFGWAEGWGFVDGDEVVLSHSEFADHKWIIGPKRLDDDLTDEQKAGLTKAGLSISWDALSGTDIVGYRVRIGSKPGVYDYTSPVINGTVFFFAPQKWKPGTYWSVIVAINSAGLESFPSKPIEITVQ